jgi:hypothetical protein
MRTSARLALAASATLTFAALGAVAPAQAATAEHCPEGIADKVELDEAGSSYDTDLAPGTVVCIKAGTGTTTAVADENGVIANTELVNKNGKYLGISYYVVIEEPECNPSVEDCDGGIS